MPKGRVLISDPEQFFVLLSMLLYGRLDLVESPILGPCIRQGILENA